MRDLCVIYYGQIQMVSQIGPAEPQGEVRPIKFSSRPRGAPGRRG